MKRATKEIFNKTKNKIKEQHQNIIKHKITFTLGILLIIILIIISQNISAEELIKDIGISNVYIIMFFLAAIAGGSIFTTAPFFTGLITSAQGGANIFILAIICGIGISIGDSIIYFVASKGKYLLKEKDQTRIDKIRKFINKIPKQLHPIIIGLQAGISPFPNEIMTISLGILQYGYKRIVTPLIIGNTIYVYLFTNLAIAGLSLLR